MSKGFSSTVIVIAVVVAVAVAVAGFYLYSQSQQTSKVGTTPVIRNNTTPAPTTAPASLESELETVTISDIEADFSDVDKNLQSL